LSEITLVGEGEGATMKWDYSPEEVLRRRVQARTRTALLHAIEVAIWGVVVVLERGAAIGELNSWPIRRQINLCFYDGSSE
jgi:hypothetical protein